MKVVQYIHYKILELNKAGALEDSQAPRVVGLPDKHINR
jgi:hypothetical protein